jgi:hypothetical protein
MAAAKLGMKLQAIANDYITQHCSKTSSTRRTCAGVLQVVQTPLQMAAGMNAQANAGTGCPAKPETSL